MNVLDPLEAAMMAGELVSSPLHVAAVLILSPPQDAGRNYVNEVHRQTVSGADQLDERLRRYPYRGLDTAGVWVWREADTVDISRHCRRRTLPAGSGPNELWRLVGELHAERLDRSRPMWISYLIDGFDDRRFALYLKVHHTAMDGVAGFQLLTDALTPDPKQRSMPAFYAARTVAPTTPAAPATGPGPNPLPLMRSLLGAATSSVGLLKGVVTGAVSNLAASLTTDTSAPPLGGPYTRFNGRPGAGRSVVAGSWPKNRFRAVRSAAAVTSNDVVMAVTAGVLRTWLLDHAELPDQSLLALCPITVRGRGHESHDAQNNMFGAWLCPLGTNLEDPVERLDLIHRSMAEGKQQVATVGSGASMLLAAPSIAGTVLLPMLPFMPKLRTGYNLPISNVPGPRVEMYWNGAHLEELYPVSTVYDGQALNVTICSYADRIGFGYVAGDEVMPDIETLIPLTERCLAELEDAIAANAAADPLNPLRQTDSCVHLPSASTSSKPSIRQS